MTRMLVLSLALLAACGPSFRDVQKENTIEAFEKFIAENPSNSSIPMAKIKLEELVLQKAREAQSLEAYDEYLQRYPEGSDAKLREQAWTEREAHLYKWAETTNTPEAWQKVLDDYPRGDKKRLEDARRRLKLSSYAAQIVVAPAIVEPANLAENPDGPLDGFLFTADVTNNTDRTITTLLMRLEYLNAEGRVIAVDNWPLVAPKAPGNLPIEEEWKVPVKPGETRTWEFLDMAPEEPGWSNQVRLIATGVQFEGEKSTQE